MSDLFKTNFVIVGDPLPPDFDGDLQDFQDALIERLSIQSPEGTNFFVSGDTEPATNVGPWLKNGDRWYVFSPTEGGYVPINIEDSVTRVFVVSQTDPGVPGEGDPLIWLRTVGTRAIAWYFWDGSQWRPGGQPPPSGTTAQRPLSPVELEQYFDTDIKCLIHFERGQWRTVSGTPGDIKFVNTATLSAALVANPGWEYVGQNDITNRGKVFAVATKDPGATPSTSFPTDTGITPRAQGDAVGQEEVILTSTQIEQHSHVVGCATALNSDNNVFLQRVDDGQGPGAVAPDTIVVPGPKPPNHFELRGDGGLNGTKNGVMPDPDLGTMLITSRQFSLANVPDYTGAALPHTNMQPTKFLWALVKL